MRVYLRELRDKLKESAISILPFFGIILVLYFIFLPFNIFSLLSIIVATMLMILGMSMFNIGVDMSTMKMGGYVGSHLSRSRKLSFMCILSFVLGFMVTIAEPDLMVLAEQVPGLNKWIVLITVSLGTGIFLLLSTLRTIFRWSIKTILILSYMIALTLCIFAPSEFLPLSFDAIGVTTGAVSVPFIMAFGLGICAVRSGKNNQEDGFGLIALASIGPVIALLIVSLFLKSNAGSSVDQEVINVITNGSDWGHVVGDSILSYLLEVFKVILPIFVFFLIYNWIYLKLPKNSLIRISLGLVYCYVGLVIFLTGVSSGYLPIANQLGEAIAGGEAKWVIIPIALGIGAVMVFAEPAVHVLNKQVEDITGGVIRRKTMMIGLSIGVAIAMLLVVLRALLGIDFMFIIVPLVVALVILSYFSPTLFVGIAFDSGGAAAGSLSASFVLPLLIGICNACGLDSMMYGFGTIGIISMIPVIVIEIIGIRYQYVVNKSKPRVKKLKSQITIIDFD
ncbi:MAG: DUF1538 domain-containing protein [Clostridiales bacterium]|nr:DUF1538 domain-containing protein [Clostridiales bacterium]